MPPALSVLLMVVASVTPGSASLPRGNDLFRLGMFRAEVDSVIAARRLAVISNGTAFLVSGSEDPAIEYVQYSFFLPPHGQQLLWKVTIGYRLEASRTDLDSVRVQLENLLGPPGGDTDEVAKAERAAADQPLPAERQLVWADASTIVRLGGRWTLEPDRNADRMLVTWTDRRIQRMLEGQRRNQKLGAQQ